MKHFSHAILFASMMLLIAGRVAHSSPPVADPGGHRTLKQQDHLFLSSSQAAFIREANTWTWISDVEHVVEASGREIVFLADSDPAYYFAGDTVPGGRRFELFPYHYYAEWEVEKLGGRVNYRLMAQNRSAAPVELTITGAGTSRSWNHGEAWAAALAGGGARNLSLAPGESATLWEERSLPGGLPWSGIFLGSATGDLFVADYCYTGGEDPGIAEARPMPDLAWPPYLLASYSRGSADWNAASIDLLPGVRDAEGRLGISRLPAAACSVAFGASPGGPITNPCVYTVVPNTFADDMVRVKDPVSGWNHLFFGGNYPVMYRFRLPLVNDTEAPVTVAFALCSNDRFGVDSLVGVWMGGRFVNDRVKPWKDNAHWRVWSMELAPGEADVAEFTVVGLGGRWGGLIGTLEVDGAAVTPMP